MCSIQIQVLSPKGVQTEERSKFGVVFELKGPNFIYIMPCESWTKPNTSSSKGNTSFEVMCKLNTINISFTTLPT